MQRALLLAAGFSLLTLCGLRAQQTVVDIIVNSPDHDTLEAAVIAAGLDDDLAAMGPFTVFAPTDAAFAALEAASPGILDALLGDSATLASVLLYHVVAADIASGDIPQGQVFPTSLRGGLSLQVVRDGGAITLNGSSAVTLPDLTATNGRVHVVDGVLLPLTIAEVVVNSPAHTTLETAIQLDAGLLAAASAPNFGPVTLYAPTDDAFAALPAGVLDSLIANPADLSVVLRYHLLGGSLFDGSVPPGLYYGAVPNGDFAFQYLALDGAPDEINGIPLAGVEVSTLNGVVQVIGQVLVPPTMGDFIAFSELHNTLEAAVGVLDPTGEGLDDPDLDATLFAPTDAAFATVDSAALVGLISDPDALEEVLGYHALDAQVAFDDIDFGLSFAQTAADYTLQVEKDTTAMGDPDLEVDNLTVGRTDLLVTNGIIHVVTDGVLMPPSVADIAVRSPIHNTLVSAASAAGLVPTLDSSDLSLTVFAPTDEAFDAVDDATLQALLADPNGLLTTVLTYHVLGEEVSSEDIVDQSITSATTLQGEDIDIAVTNGAVVLNGSVNVIVADVFGTNGVVHVIDGVLLPDAIVSTQPEPAAAAGIRIAPIPADVSTTVTLPAELAAANASLTVLDARGAAVLSRVLRGAQTQVDVAELPAGNYYFLVEADGDAYYQPVVVR